VKKKPPPGATLISRLKEGRARREQQLAERQARAEQPDVDEAPDEVEASAEPEKAAVAVVEVVAEQDDPEIAEKPKAKVRPPKEEPKSDNNGAESAPKLAPPVALNVEVTKDTDVPLVSVSKSDPPAPQPTQVQVLSPEQPGEFVRRSISIEDLRPVSDEYDLLTDEIRLAGRFAAAGLIAQGLRLTRLREAELYKEHYQTFEDYCRKEHSMSATYAYRLIRMSDMAEKLSVDGHRFEQLDHAMPDPFEVLLSLGHRHLMALLPLEIEKAEDLLIHGIPADEEDSETRIPIGKATEQQIRKALRRITGDPEPAPKKPKARVVAEPKPLRLVAETPSVQTLADMANRLDDWADWLEVNPPVQLITQLMAEVRAGRIKDGKEIARLAQQLGSASQRILELLEPLQGGKNRSKA
jgi:hypothetical protein